VLAVAGDALAEWQDSLHKGEVTEYEIFRRACAHWACFCLCFVAGQAGPFSTPRMSLQRRGLQVIVPFLYRHLDLNCFACR